MVWRSSRNRWFNLSFSLCSYIVISGSVNYDVLVCEAWTGTSVCSIVDVFSLFLESEKTNSQSYGRLDSNVRDGIHNSDRRRLRNKGTCYWIIHFQVNRDSYPLMYQIKRVSNYPYRAMCSTTSAVPLQQSPRRVRLIRTEILKRLIRFFYKQIRQLKIKFSTVVQSPGCIYAMQRGY